MARLHVAVAFFLAYNILLSLSQETFDENKPLEPHCTKQAKCEPIQNATCLGVNLPYLYTSFSLANDSNNLHEVQQKLLLWSGLQSAPKCWEKIQPLLCAVYMPKCNVNGTQQYIELPSRELCDVTREPCKIVASYHGWPEFLQCDKPHFPKKCPFGPVQKLNFNTTGKCEPPLIPTENKGSWYHDVEGCGIQCQNPLFSQEEHDHVHMFVLIMASACLTTTLFTLLTFAIDWKNAARYPAVILFFINGCFFLGSIGWLAQFFPGAREDIVCRKDGTIRKEEPQLGAGESPSCFIVFSIVYYTLIASLGWFVILAYSWHLTFRAIGSVRDVIEGKRGTFHMIAWSLPLVLTIVCLALTQIDGDSVSGICFVGNLNHMYRGGFVLIPVGLAIIGGLFFLLRGLITLIKIKIDSPGLISDRASAKIRDTIIRIGVFAGLAFLFSSVTFIVHFYIFTSEEEWSKSFTSFVVCEANRSVTIALTNRTTACTMKNRPNLIAMESHIFSYFAAGIVMSSWVWNKSTFKVWKAFFKRCRDRSRVAPAPVKQKKHRQFKHGFRNRHHVRSGRTSVSLTHDDQAGMNSKMDVSSVSQDVSSVWAVAVPRTVPRKGIVPQTAPRATSRRFSDSDIQSVHSHSIQSHSQVYAFQSRRMSVDSQASEQSDGKRKTKKKKVPTATLR